MKSMFLFRSVFFSFVAVFACASLAAEPTLTVQVNTRQIYLGDSFSLEVTLDQTSPGGASPEFTDDFQAQVYGGSPRSQSSRNITIINGRRTETVVERTSWSYSVVPEDAGVFKMGAVMLQAADRTLTARVPDIRVIGAQKQSHVAISLDSSRLSVLLEESFDVTLGIKVTQLGGDAADYHPLPEGDRTPVLLDIPFLAEDAVKGADFRRPLDQLLNPFLQRHGDAGAFRINKFSVDSGVGMFSLFSERRAAVFYLGREATQWDDGRPAWIYRLKFPMKATAEGISRFGAVRFKGSVIVEADGERALTSVFTVSDPLEVRVTPPPEAGRPASFIGSLGTSMDASVSLDAQTCRQGDPLKLTLEISGDLTTSNMREPDVFNASKLAERFRQYGDVIRDRTSNGMRFTYRVRPIVSGTIEVPPLELAFYNTETREYETFRTAPVPLRVDPAPEVNVDQILGFSTNAFAEQMAIRQERVPSAITLSSAALLPAPPPARLRIAATLCAPPIFVFMLVGLLALWRRRQLLHIALRRHSAVSRSVRGVLRAKTPEAVMRAVAVFLRDKAGAAGDGFTPGDVRTILAKQGVDAARCDEIESLLQEVFNSGFRPDADPAAVVKSRRGRIAECLAALRLSVLVLAAAGLAVTASAAPDRARVFLWKQAQAEVASAKTDKDFLRAGRVYRELLDEGCSSGRVFYNYGTVMMLADFPEVAVDAFERAEALDGASPELENNLDLALRAARQAAEGDTDQAWQGGNTGSSLPWYRVPLFWHYRTPVAVRVDALILAWWVLWLGVMLKGIGLRRSGRGLAIVGLLGLAVFGSSVLASYRVLDRPLPELPEQVENSETAEGMAAP